jgi:hypothetical protein
MQTPEITAYLKTYCGWSAGVRAVLAKYKLPYTEKDIIQNPAFRWEMETKSGQPLSPSVREWRRGRELLDRQQTRPAQQRGNGCSYECTVCYRATRRRSKAEFVGSVEEADSFPYDQSAGDVSHWSFRWDSFSSLVPFPQRNLWLDCLAL